MKTASLSLFGATILGLSAPYQAYAADEFDTKTEKTVIDMMRESPDSIPLEPRDPNRDLLNFYVDCENIEGREPGPINIQSTAGGYAQLGIPTFFRQPVAVCPQDLVAGEVDIAIMGAPIDLGTAQRGTSYAPGLIRVGEPLAFWGDFIPNAHPTVGDIDPMRIFNVVDYGDAVIDPFSNERSILSVHHRVTGIVEAGAVPFVVGGDHSLMYPDVVAVTDFYGKGKVAVVHFDAHYDATALAFGHYLTHGGPVRRLIDEGHVPGELFWQIGLNSAKPDGKDLTWMRQNNIRFRYMHEIDRKGWREVLTEVLEEVAASGIENVYISLDTDVLEPAFAPGMGTPEPGGMTIRELFPMLRGIAAATNVVGLEIVEVNPIVDTTYRSRQVAVRAMREMLTGMAMRKQGITDPFYVDPLWGEWDNGAQ